MPGGRAAVGVEGGVGASPGGQEANRGEVRPRNALMTSADCAEIESDDCTLSGEVVGPDCCPLSCAGGGEIGTTSPRRAGLAATMVSGGGSGGIPPCPWQPKELCRRNARGGGRRRRCGASTPSLSGELPSPARRASACGS